MKVLFTLALVACAGRTHYANNDPNETTLVALSGTIVKKCDIDGDTVAVTMGQDSKLKKVADCLSDGDLEDKQVRVTGYRSENVANYLRRNGVKSDKVSVSSLGGSDDRRVAIEVVE